MPEFSTSIQAAPTDFGSVRAVRPSTSNTDLIATGLSAIVKGAEVFGKANAREAGQEAALSQQGLDLSLETVFRKTPLL